ncbi:hypothetical protein CY34DRAFT_785536 [Suillus luteus UH-Slu-Lm8-n1]|uniref:Glycine cleavage system P-protein N-terminal domain-containing protein n=1 Tax=Suillus luteus UH-Slu-Lm8-n1 TaxID=930992 RepID=A0A0D0AK07_9AGAM|nr:hypothetical protein CY34DRAFT_785536 [Suillus luteus UH-Slu-Lm8-n1]
MVVLRVASTCLRQSAAPNDNETEPTLPRPGSDPTEPLPAATIPQNIRIAGSTISNASIPALSETELHASTKKLGRKNEQFKDFIGMGYHNAVVPPVILRNVFENPAWYTPYTLYQPEIAQGHLESLVNFQTMITSLTSMHISNTSLLDEATAAAEAMVMAYARVHEAGALVIVATDLLALTLLKPPGEWGADVVLGNSARFGVPVGYEVPRGAFFAVAEKLKRKIPGRLIGRRKDTMGNPAYRLALQTREQHIRREKANSNICTSQALLANMAAMYAVYHGPVGFAKKCKDLRMHKF